MVAVSVAHSGVAAVDALSVAVTPVASRAVTTPLTTTSSPSRTGFTKQERTVLTEVTQARANAAGSLKLTPEALNDPQAMQKFAAAQGQLSGALSRLLVTVERYPELKSDRVFQGLMTELEGTENR